MDTINPSPILYQSQNGGDPWAKRYSLSLDSGGVRGYSSLLILKKLMDIIGEIEVEYDEAATHSYYPEAFRMSYDASRTSERFANDYETEGGQSVESQADVEGSHRYLPCHYFDFIAGNGTGGIIAIMLARLRMSVGEAQEAFTDMSKRVFSGARAPVWFPGINTYNHRKLEKVVKSVVERRIPIAESDRLTRGKCFFSELNGICNCIVVAYGESKEINIPYLFRSYISPRMEYPFKRNLGIIWVRNDGSRDRYPIWTVARATLAASGYLRKVKIEDRLFVNGGLDCSNPSLELYQEIKFLYGRVANALILSIGTGITPPPSIFGNNINIVTIASRIATDSEKTHETMRVLSISDGFFYQRFNVQEFGLIKLGAYRELDKIEELTNEYLLNKDVINSLRWVAELLVKIRRDRVIYNRDRWEAFCCDTRYPCEEGPEGFCQYDYQERTRRCFEEHLQHDHGLQESSINKIVEESKRRIDKHMKTKAASIRNGAI